MLYDLASEPPRPGSLLGSMFTFIAERRQEAEYFKTKALIAATLADKVEGGGKLLEEAWGKYRELLFPFLAQEKAKLKENEKKAMEQWTSKVLKVRPLWRAQDHKGIVSRLRRGAEKVRKAEELRRKVPHRRI